MREKRKKCFCCAYAHKIALYVSNFFMFYAFMFYARIKWPPRPNFLCAHKTDTHINIKRKSAYVEPVCHKNTRTSHATTNNKKSCAHPTLQRLCPPLFMGRAEAPPNHVTAAPHHHTEAASCRGLLVWGDLKWGVEIEREGVRGYLGLSCPPIDGGTQQPTKSRLRLLGGALERRRGWVGTCGEDGCLSFEKSNGATKK
jgi:hypothetical protein